MPTKAKTMERLPWGAYRGEAFGDPAAMPGRQSPTLGPAADVAQRKTESDTTSGFAAAGAASRTTSNWASNASRKLHSLFLYFREPLDMEPEEAALPVTPTSGPATQVSSSNGGATAASSGSQGVKWKKDVLPEIEVESEDGKITKPPKEKDAINRPCKEHSFLTDVADVRMMEQGLLQLLDDFHSGKLQAFGVDSSCDKMDQIREQQERLARLHFDLDLQQDLHRLDTDTARKNANENLGKLIDQLQCLSTSIQTLQKNDTPATSSTNP